MATDNKSLGRFKLMGIPPAPRGVPQVLVSLDIDANGILQVSALDKTTGREQGITVQGASNLDEEEVQRMIREAEEYSASDRLQRERVEKRNRSEALTFQAERVLREVTLDFGMQFARDRRLRIEGLIRELRDNLEQGDERGIDIAQAELQDELYELNREAYLYDEEEDEGNLLEQIGGTLRRTFAGDDDQDWDFGRDSDYYRQSSWDQRSKLNEPSWGYDDRRDQDDRYGRYDQYNRKDNQNDRYGRDDRSDQYGQDDRYGRDDRNDRVNQDDQYVGDDQYNRERNARDQPQERDDRGVRYGDRAERYDRSSGSYPPSRQSPNPSNSRPNRYGNAHDEDWDDDDEWF